MSLNFCIFVTHITFHVTEVRLQVNDAKIKIFPFRVMRNDDIIIIRSSQAWF